MSDAEKILEEKALRHKEFVEIRQNRVKARRELSEEDISLREAFREARRINGSISKYYGKGSQTLITCHFPTLFRDLCDALVIAGLFVSRSEIMRIALREYLKGYMNFEDMGLKFE